MRVDEPDFVGVGGRLRLLAGEGAGHEARERLAQAVLDLAVDRAISAPAARAFGAIELRAQAFALSLDGLYDS
ncbi:MAG: hypothetical protein K0S03_1418 [Burkholderiales bacterium]|nr:hypothetical protein [Burkholderiales bacterium]